MAIIQQMNGFQSACAEYAEDVLSLDKKYIQKPSSTFFIRVSSDSKFLQVFKGDILLVDRSLNPATGDLVVAVISNTFVLGTYSKVNGIDYVLPYNKKLGDVEAEEDFLWGVAVIQIRHRRKVKPNDYSSC